MDAIRGTTAKEFACEIAKIDGDSLIAVFAIGSLGGGYYRPGQSDIDTLIIVDDSKETLLTNKVSGDKILVEKLLMNIIINIIYQRGLGQL